jgi:phosphatidylserine decarboxylase
MGPLLVPSFLLAGALLLAGVSRKWCVAARSAAHLIGRATLGGAVIGLLAGRLRLGWPVAGLLALTSQGLVFVVNLLLLFYQDPERTGPDDPGGILSPADGKVIYVRRSGPDTSPESVKNGDAMTLDEFRETCLANRELCQIGIAMVLTDVHINRAPIAGRVTMVRHRPGKFLSLRRKEAAAENERQTVIIESNGLIVAIVQIASRLVRRIEAYVSEGDTVRQGQRVGMIRFGSQVDVFVPSDIVESVEVETGRQIKAGETILCRVRG